MFTDPALTPVTTPPDDTVAIVLSELDQIPPELASLSVVCELTHTDIVPVIAAGVTEGLVTVALSDIDLVQPLVAVPIIL